MSEQTFTGTTDADGYLPITWTAGDPLIVTHTPTGSIASQEYDPTSKRYDRVRFLSFEGVPLPDRAVSVTIRDAAEATEPEEATDE